MGDHFVDGNNKVVSIPDLAPSMLRDEQSGFDAAIYRNTTRGNMSLPSLARANVRAGRGGYQSQRRTSLGADNGPISTSHRLAKRAVEAFGKGNVVFMGHSLGGGLASVAMLATGVPGVTFNAADLSDSTLRSLKPGKTPTPYARNWLAAARSTAITWKASC